ncbi:MAG: mechanosensitive ion channel family protein, partial [Bacteroidales bacterium]|nr:mechanosensitive ion channel family protein [Bacteroidales bacterium]
MVVHIRIILVLLMFSVCLSAQEGSDSVSPAEVGQQDSVASSSAEAKVTLNVEVDSATGIHAKVTSEGGEGEVQSLVEGGGDKAGAKIDTTGIERGMKGAETIDHLKDTISFSKIFWSVIFLLAGYLFIKYSVKLMDLFAESSTRVRLGVKRFIPIYRIIAWTLVIFIVIKGVISPSWEAVVALGASVGVSVGFAAQDILKNIFGGITILAEKPFQVGDKID